MPETIIPNHVGIILDGNRRWAKERGLPTLEGHRHGSEALKKVALDAFDKGVKVLSAFIFSAENWTRTKEEVGYLMRLVVKLTEKYLDTFIEKDVRIVFVGRRDKLEGYVLKAIDKAQEVTKNNKNGIFVFCLNYGGQDEMVDVAKKLVESGVKAEDITKELFEENLYCPEVPPIDLLIRTSGEQRTSGFMLYRAAYAELIFYDKYWPDFSTIDFDNALAEYAARERRFGK